MFIFFRLYYGEVYPHTGMLYFVVGITLLFLGKLQEALEALNKASAILTVIYGDKYHFLREVLKPLLRNVTIHMQTRYSS